jgi:chloramphenicol O-acetyltransferase type A
MRYIDKKTWPRRQHFEFFTAFDHPQAGLTANVDVTAFHPFVKQRGHPITVAIVYVLSRAANAIPEFRYRIRGTDVVEHEIVHPAFTILGDDDLFGFCTLDYAEDFSQFVANAAERIASARENPTLEEERGEDDVLYMTAVPWVSFTGILHPLHLDPGDSVPRIAWGRFFEEGNSLKMPLGVQAHHALMDGIHMGRFFASVQEDLDHPGSALGEA